MKKVEHYKNMLMEEVEGAKMYAEYYIAYKNTSPQWAKMFASMARDELQHANYIETISQEAVSKMAWVPEEDQEKWERCLKKKAETVALVELMLSK